MNASLVSMLSQLFCIILIISAALCSDKFKHWKHVTMRMRNGELTQRMYHTQIIWIWPTNACKSMSPTRGIYHPLWFSGFLGSLQDPELPTPFVFWFGLSLNQLDGTWRWSAMDHNIYWSNWDNGEPSIIFGENSACLKFSVFKWHGCFHYQLLPYMCEIWK